MSKTLTLSWTNTTPPPSCGFKAMYRKKGFSGAYTEIDVSSGTSTSVVLDTPANYEGKIIGNCCSSNLSTGDPFGVNSYQPFHLHFIKGITLSGITYIDGIISGGGTDILLPYSNPYPLVVTGNVTFNYDISGHTHTIPYSITLGATAVYQRTSFDSGYPTLPTTVTTSYTVTSITPIFSLNTAGLVSDLQIFDLDNTSDYFKWYWDGASGTTGSSYLTCTLGYGSISLPSFTIDSFSPTLYNVDGDTIRGNLSFSWAQEVICSGGTFPHNSVMFTIEEAFGDINGTIIVPVLPKGLRTVSLPILANLQPMNATTLYSMKIAWADGTSLNSANFYLPI